MLSKPWHSFQHPWDKLKVTPTAHIITNDMHIDSAVAVEQQSVVTININIFQSHHYIKNSFLGE